MPSPLYRLIADTTGLDQQVELARAAGVHQSAISRWKRGEDSTTDNVIAVARAIGIPPVEALVRVGVIKPGEVTEVIRVTENRVLTNDELLALVRERMRDDRGDAAPMNSADELADRRPARSSKKVRFVADDGNQVRPVTPDEESVAPPAAETVDSDRPSGRTR